MSRKWDFPVLTVAACCDIFRRERPQRISWFIGGRRFGWRRWRQPFSADGTRWGNASFFFLFVSKMLCRDWETWPRQCRVRADYSLRGRVFSPRLLMLVKWWKVLIGKLLCSRSWCRGILRTKLISKFLSSQLTCWAGAELALSFNNGLAFFTHALEKVAG